MVENEVGALKEAHGDRLIFFRGGGHRPDDGITDREQEISCRACAQKVDIANQKTLALDAHVEKRLMYNGCFAAFRGFVDYYILSGGEQVAENGGLAAPADEILSGYMLVIYKR